MRPMYEEKKKKNKHQLKKKPPTLYEKKKLNSQPTPTHQALYEANGGPARQSQALQGDLPQGIQGRGVDAVREGRRRHRNVL